MRKNNLKKVIFAIIKYGTVLTVEFAGGVLGMILWLNMSVPDWMSFTLTIASLAAIAGTVDVIDDAIETEKKKKKRMAKRRAMREKKPSKTYKYL